ARRDAHPQGPWSRLHRQRIGAAQRERRAHPGLPRQRDLRARREPPEAGQAVNLENFGMDTVTLAGSLERKRRAVREAGFGQIMLSARDVVEHPGGQEAAIAAVRGSGLRVTGFQVLRDFEGLPSDLHAYKLDVAKAMLTICRALGSKVLLVCSS